MSNAGFFDNGGGGGGDLVGLEGNTGGEVLPFDGIIRIIGTGNVAVTGNPLTNTLVITDTAASGVTWSHVTATTQAMTGQSGYLADCSSQALVFTLPSTCAQFAIIEIVGINAAQGWVINQNAGQSIVVNNATTTVGVSGSLTAGLFTDSLRMICTVANTKFQVLSTMSLSLAVV